MNPLFVYPETFWRLVPRIEGVGVTVVVRFVDPAATPVASSLG